jgi:glycosyltransferase involved in cell wall biosynthesis
VIERSRRRSISRTIRRLAAHTRRALHAIRRAGPGRYPGAITAVELTASGEIGIEGFAHVLGDSVASVVVTVDGRVIGAAPVDLDTPELAAARPADAGSRRAGWRLVVPRDAVSAGAVIFDAVALTQSGLTEALEAVTWTMPSGPPHAPAERAPTRVTGELETAHAFSYENGAVIVTTGWAAPARLVDRVDVFVDDAATGAARPFCVPRTEIADLLDDPTASLAGFWHLAEIDRAPGTTVRVSVEAVSRFGNRMLGESEVVIAPAAPRADAVDRGWLAALRARADIAADACVPAGGLNLFVVAHDLRLGGAQLCLLEILRRVLPKLDVACTVIAPFDGPLRRELEASGARVHVTGRFPFEAAEYESTVREMAQIVASDGCNVALVNSLGSFIGVDVASRCGIPSVLAIHEHYSLDAFLHFAFGDNPPDEHVCAQARRAIEQASLVCFVAGATMQRFTDAIDPPDDERFARIEYGIPLAEFTPGRYDRARIRAAHGFTTDDRVLLCAGTVEPRKCQSSLVLALDRIIGQHPDVQLVLVGMEPTPYGDAVAALVSGLGLERRVRLVDSTPDVAPWYAIADALVLASDAESLPRVVIEAMACEVPALATDVGGVAELVRDGDTGLLCEARDIGALARGLDRLLTLPPEELRAMVARAAKHIGPHREVESYAAKFEALLRALAKDPAVSPRAVFEEQ